ncbi:helix-turn-helix transcriptional regulator [Agilicoccus flavus]|uniref:helix-turn-helix transcriptional regulator n=1 Tax=Agilicoccus flavus TaxID=2775968 RepID=UPI001CF6DE45|nr:helix-turn-helix domain-containing protein [Agilicoccus flavus]
MANQATAAAPASSAEDTSADPGDATPPGPPPGYLTAEMIAADLARVTGKKAVPASTIRAMASRGQLPAPAPCRWGRRTLWESEAIAAWLARREAKHVPPGVVRQIQRRLAALDEQSRETGNDARLKQGVRNAYRRGLSLQQIADAIKVKNGDHHPTREAVRSRFGPYL